jgi:RHS repeat-associated protein
MAASAPLMVTPGQFGVSSTGAATYTIPIVVPPGTSGLVPSLSLSYSSQSGDGFVGVGWSLGGLHAVTRCPRTLAQDGTHGSVNYDSNDQFCMDGQRLISTGTTSTLCASGTGTVYSTEIESFSRVISCGSTGSGTGPGYFKVWTKNGKILELGNTPDSSPLVIAVVSGTPAAGTVRAWMVNKISDTAGNYMAISYSCAPNGGGCASGDAYPTRIDYTGNATASLSPYNSVRFEYATRNDSYPLYQAGGVVTPTYILSHIKTYQGANLVLDYQLGYRAGSNVTRSRLTSLTQCDNSAHCLPQVSFGWQGGGSAFSLGYDTTTTHGTGETIIPGDWNGDGLTDFADVALACPSSMQYPVYLGQNPFGFSYTGSYSLQLPSIAPYDTCTTGGAVATVLAPNGTSQVILNILASYSLPHPPPVNKYLVSSITTAGATFLRGNTTPFLTPAPIAPGDYNGDGVPDYFLVESPTSNIYLGSTTSATFNSPTAFWTGLNYSSASVQGGDFDGDGCADFWGQDYSGTPINTIFFASTFCHPVQSTISAPSITDPAYLGDFNGDGKTDIFVPASSHLYLSTGTGFVDIYMGAIPVWDVKAVGDWNGDGKSDILVQEGGSGDYKIYLSTGSGFVAALDGSGNPIVVSGSAGATVIPADWNSDGATDMLVRITTTNNFYALPSYAPELMTSVSNGVGATTSINFDRINKNGSFYSVGTGATYPTQDLDGPIYVVAEVDSSNGLGTCNPSSSYANCYRTSYSYGGAKKDLNGRGFLGFSTVVASDLQTNIVRTTSYCTLFPLTGRVSTDVRIHSGTTLSSVTNQYNGMAGCGATGSSGVNVVQVSESVESGHDLNGSALPTTTTDFTYDGYGNALTINVSVSDGSSRHTANTYCTTTPCLNNWFISELLTTSVNSIVGSSNLTRQSSFAYDAATGLLTQVSLEPGISTCNSGSSHCELDTSYTYDAFGNRVTVTIFDAAATIPSRTSYVFYDSNGEFMTASANALGQYEFWAYDQRFGTPTSHTGPNFLTTTWAYDSFGRLTQQIRPDSTQTNLSYAYCSGSCPTYGQFYSRSEIDASGGSPQIGPISYAYYDMLSRGIANDVQGFDGSNIRVATAYDANGRVQQASRPYFTGSASPAWTQFTYDDLGRVTQATFPDSSHTTYNFNGLTTSVTNNLSQTTTTVKNAQGLNYQVTDATSHTVTYIYDAFGDALTVTDPASNTMTNSFDIRGNKYRSQDPDMGTWNYAYDVLAELTSQTDAKTQTTSLTYDLLGRPLTRAENDLYSAWTYGTSAANHNVGQVVEAKTCPTSACSSIVSDKTYLFDGVGRESLFTLQTPTDYYGYYTTYSATNGQIASIKYPSGYTVNRNYNNTGFLTQLTEAGSNLPIWTINTRDAELHITSQTAGNNVLTTQAFDPDTGLIQNQRAGGGSVASFDYSFDTIGNLTARSDNSQPYTERFCYDGLNRLANYNLGAACTGGTTVGYDTIGNITSKTGTGTYSYGSRPHAVSSITGTVDGLTNPSYTYDANGNLTCTSSGAGCSGTIGRSLNLTSFNMAASLIQGSNSLNMTYDDQHQRLQQTNTVSGTATTKTVYVNDAASGAMSERVTASGTTPTIWNSFNWGAAPWGGVTANALPTFTDYITIDGQIVAQRKVTYPLASAWGLQNWNGFNWGPPAGSLWGSTAGTNPPRFKWGTDPWSGNVIAWNYFSLDHLGSVSVITDQGGNVVQRLSFDPWGKQRNANGTSTACGTITSSTTRGFTGQEEMPTQCLVNLNARLYDASIGKFMVADSITSEPYNGQSYNRYAYVTNNPLSFTDPTGHYNFADAMRGGLGAGDISYSIVFSPGTQYDVTLSATWITTRGTTIIGAGVITPPNSFYSDNPSGVPLDPSQGYSVTLDEKQFDDLVHNSIQASGFTRTFDENGGVLTEEALIHESNAPAAAPVAQNCLGCYQTADITINDFYNEVGGFGHVGVGVNTNKTQGLYPKDQTTWHKVLEFFRISIPGAIKDDDLKEPHASVTIQTTPAEDEAAQLYIDQTKAHPPNYNLYEKNCAKFCEGTLGAAGKSAPSTMFPNKLFDMLLNRDPKAEIELDDKNKN